MLPEADRAVLLRVLRVYFLRNGGPGGNGRCLFGNFHRSLRGSCKPCAIKREIDAEHEARALARLERALRDLKI